MRRLQRERLLRAMYGLRRLLLDRTDRMRGDEEGFDEAEYVAECRRLLAVDRIVLSLHRLLGHCSTVGLDGRVDSLYVNGQAAAA